MEIASVIRDYIFQELLRGEAVDLDEDTPLVEDGYLTSLQTVELVMFLEERFPLQIDPEEVNEEEFRSLRTITSLVERKIG